MNEAAVEKAVLLGWYWENEINCRRHNEVISDWCEKAPERFIGFAAVSPAASPVDQLERAKSLGLEGVGELHPGVQDFSFCSDEWEELATWCTTENWPINFHVTRPSDDHPSAVPTPLEDYAEMARQAPKLKIIFAHWGGGLPLLLQNSDLKNVYYDCSASPLMYDMEIFKEMVALVGRESILFGSDYPLRIFPRKFKTAEMKHYIDRIRDDSGLCADDLAALMGENAQSLFTR